MHTADHSFARGLRWKYLRHSFGFLFGAIWGFVGTVFVIVAAAVVAQAWQYHTGGMRAAAVVVERGEDAERNGSSKHWVRAVFDDSAGTEHIGVFDMGWQRWRGLESGDSIAIEYLAAAPHHSRLADEPFMSRWGLPMIFGVVGFAFGGIGWVLVVGAYRKAGRRASLLVHGTACAGTVLGVDMNTSVRINRRHPWFVRYEFTGSDGVERTGESPHLPRGLETRWSPGDAITIVQDPFDPLHHEVDVFDVRCGDPGAAGA